MARSTEWTDSGIPVDATNKWGAWHRRTLLGGGPRCPMLTGVRDGLILTLIAHAPLSLPP